MVSKYTNVALPKELIKEIDLSPQEEINQTNPEEEASEKDLNLIWLWIVIAIIIILILSSIGYKKLNK